MNKQAILKPAKTYAFGLKQLKRAVRELGLEVADEIGVELLRVDGIYYVVKNVYKPTPWDTILSTNDATERILAGDIVAIYEAERVGA